MTKKRILSFFMCIMLIVGLLPMGAIAFAASDTEYLFIATDRHANTSIIGNIINNIESNIGENEIDYLALGGDMVGSGNSHPAYNSSEVLGEATGATTSLSAANVDIVAGIHDMNVTDDAGIVLPYQGGCAEIYAGDKYYVYGVEEYCISEDSNESNWSAQAQKFVDWANGSAIDKSKAIIVVSHYPLHAKRDDNDGAYYWHQALNEVATGGGITVERDIVFFHGHNHTVDGNEYVYNVGDTMEIQNGSSTTSDTIYYTYATAGYLNQNSKATLVSITDNEIVLQKYSTSGSGTAMAAITRVAPTLSSIAISGTTEYTVGDALALTVTATYSDGTTADVTADATLTGYDMSVAGTQTVTAAYEELTATINITVTDPSTTLNTVTCWDDTDTVSVQATAIGLTDISATNMSFDYDVFNNAFTDHMALEIALTGHTEGNEVKYSIAMVENMDTTNLKVYYLDGEEAVEIECEVVTDAQGNKYVEFTTAYVGTFAYGSPVVPEGYEIYSVELSNIPTDVFVNDSIDMTEAQIKVTYKMDGAEDFIRMLTVYDYDFSNFNEFSTSEVGEEEIIFTFEGISTSFYVDVWNNEFEVNGVTVQVGSADFGVTSANVAESTNENVKSAVAYVISGDKYVAYDISLNFESGYTQTATEKTVILPVPDGVANPVVYYVSEDGSAVEPMNATLDDNGTVTFTTTHFSTYVVGESTEIEVADPNTEEVTTGSTTKKTVYVLTSSISAGNSYLIVNSNSAGDRQALANNNGSVAATGVTVSSGDVDGDGDSETYIELNDAADELWEVGSGYTFENGGYYLGYTTSGNNWNQSYTFGLSTTSRNWSYSTSNNRLSTSVGNWNSTTYYLRYNNGWTWTSSNNGNTSGRSIYFYVPTEITIDTTTTGTYAIAGNPEEVKTVVDEDGTTTTTLSSNITFTDSNGSESTLTADEIAALGGTLSYEVYTNGSVTGDPNGVITSISADGTVTFSGEIGKALVKVSYTWGDNNEYTIDNYITVYASAPYYTIDLHKAEVAYTEASITEFAEGETYYTLTDGVYSVATEYVEGTTYYTASVTVGEEITAPVALKGVQANDTYSVWAVIKAYTSENPDGEDLEDVADDRIYWTVSDTTIATIDKHTGVLTFTGENYGTFTVTARYLDENGETLCEDTITISVTESEYVVPGDGTDDFPEYPNEGSVRFDKTATAVGNYSETGIAKVELSMTGVPYTTGSEIDVVIMLDMTGSMSDTAMAAAEESAIAFAEQIVKNEDGTFNDNRICVMAFNSGSKSPYTYWELGTITADQWDDFCTAVRGASEDQVSGGTPYDAALEKCKDVLAAAKTDGTGNDRQQFCVFVSDGGPTSYEYITNYDAVKAGTATEYTTSSASATGGANQSDSNFATIATYTHEYYSTLMKDAGVTMFSVLTGLSADSYPNCATIMENIASSSDNAYVVEDGSDTSAITGALSSIAQKILEAAKNIVVEDKIGENYTINFSVPGYGTDNALTSEELDNTTNFYIQVVEYTLDENKNRTGDPTVLENFTFNEDGTLKSHTVDGAACGDTCSHITFAADGVTITAIDGTYFEYKSDDSGEYLTWKAEKLTTTELALQYFAYLDNSSGLSEEEIKNGEQIPAGTYYTNEYATLTYENYKGNTVQQEFPVPQMTWNGAQVSYVFYLVNEAGQPVNRAGKVVPFAEAVYVTDVYTHHIIWNDLEQAAGLDASYLAEDIVPDVYALYDNDASYSIHVYEDESEVNLNNHFVIGGDVTDEYNTITNSWTNANTTYVFNTKADANKYNGAGAYIAYDDTQVATAYFCKSAAIEGATYTTSIDAATGATLYTVNLNGNSYTPVDGETQVTEEYIQSKGGITTNATVIDGYVYYVDENGAVYTIVEKTDGSEVHEGFDFHNTTVAFAVVWKPELAEDAVVVDYGLDVVIDVTANDAMAAGVVGVRADAPADVEINSGNYTAAKSTSADVTIDGYKIGTATVEANSITSVRFSLDKTYGMQFTEPAKFYYEADVNYYDSNNVLKTESMYSSVTVIPATTVYYEDDFVTLTTYAKNDEGVYAGTLGNGWDTNSVSTTKHQDTDRPGENKLGSGYDADNIYGYDSAYKTLSTYSMNNSAKITVNADKRGEATFTFWGTGFDVVSMTSNTTGSITVEVFNADGENVKTTFVDTYYGMNHDGTVNENAVNDPTMIYQVPVIKIFDLPYAQYKVTITAGYNKYFDHTGSGSYDFYLDAIRIYDPTGNLNEIANDAYKADGESGPVYTELRNNIIAATGYTVTENADGTVTVTGSAINGAVFIDCTDSTSVIADYVNHGPNNELYLKNGQAIAFNVVTTGAADVQLGIKMANGDPVTYTISATNGTDTISESVTVSTATDMYYSILKYAKYGTVTIKNTSGGILSLTNIKVTQEQASSDVAAANLLWMDAETTGFALMSFRAYSPESTEPEDTTTEDTESDVTEPEDTTTEDTESDAAEPEDTTTEDTESNVTEPEDTTTEDTESDATEPEDTTTEDTESDVTEPEDTTTEDTESDVTEPDDTETEETESGFAATVKTVVNAIANFFKNLFGWLFN
ncbi:MAG: VWA domain-containing protein [Oscillospiraceae bacterium]|nr:VWA domain-containing protein [Oscillospiraceae bacterium]